MVIQSKHARIFLIKIYMFTMRSRHHVVQAAFFIQVFVSAAVTPNRKTENGTHFNISSDNFTQS